MSISRRNFIGTATAAAGVLTTVSRDARAATSLAAGRDATQFGVRPNSPDDQTRVLQKAIDQCSAGGWPLALPPGTYRTGALDLPDGAQIAGVRGATTLSFTGGRSLIACQGSRHIGLTGLVLDGGNIPLPNRRGLVHCLAASELRITDCDITACGGNGIWLENASGEIRNNNLSKIAVTGLVSFDALGLLVTQNVIRDTSDNGIEILRTDPGDDGSIVTNNRIENIKAGAGGSGQHGNAINAFRANNVIISGNRIDNCDYSGVRGNTASNIQIIGNNITNVREVALYSEFSFEAAIIANNTVDGCATGVSVCNFNEGGRIAVVQGNILRNILPKRPIGTAPDDDGGVGIYVEADSTVSGNVIENAPSCGIVAGWGPYLRDISISGNVVRHTPVGIGVSVVGDTGKTVITGNMISDVTRGAIVGYDHAKPVTGDLMAAGTADYPKIVMGRNVVR